jgi:hypothetical protein
MRRDAGTDRVNRVVSLGAQTMTAKEIIDDLRALGRQDLTVILTYIADRLHSARLSGGERVLDSSDFAAFLHELAFHARVGSRPCASVTARSAQQRFTTSTTPVHAVATFTRATRSVASRLVADECAAVN